MTSESNEAAVGRVRSAIRDAGIVFGADPQGIKGWRWGSSGVYEWPLRYDDLEQARAERRAFLEGFEDGVLEPEEIGMGMSYDSPALDEAYGHGANLGQALMRGHRPMNPAEAQVAAGQVIAE